MNVTDILEKIGDKLGSAATVKAVYGEPIHANGRTVVPIAKVAYGFGGGFGSGRGKLAPEGDAGADPKRGEGGGGGGGVRAFPAGALEITEEGTRFVPYTDFRPLAIAFAAGALLGTLLFHRRGD
jgi:uncharacterized spore protein YtfJ